MLVLGIETSCDETAVALYDEHKGLVANGVYSQIPVHKVYGGVVPELASREHVKKTLPLLQQILDETGLSLKHLDGIAYTKGPGLIGALLVGATFAKTLSYALKIPCVGVHHMESHLMAVMLEENKPRYPFLALLVSGGHTLLVKINDFGNYHILGESVDDAVGEAFDKVAKLLGLEQPGGPAVAKLAEEGKSNQFTFPRPMLDQPNFNFSFSGLKTAVVRAFQTSLQDKQSKADIARAFEEAVIETLATKCERALDYSGFNDLVVAGGVAANHKLRICLKQILQKRSGQVFFPRKEFCTDNAAMVAYNGFLHLKQGECEDWSIQVKPKWVLI